MPPLAILNPLAVTAGSVYGVTGLISNSVWQAIAGFLVALTALIQAILAQREKDKAKTTVKRLPKAYEELDAKEAKIADLQDQVRVLAQKLPPPGTTYGSKPGRK
jgi:tetrahydromethanopterin S-methyltransferase subunit B